jgi:hypothetical protein
MATITHAVNTSTVDNTVDCKSHPLRCLRQITIDGVVFAALYVALSYIVDKQMPTVNGILGFVSIWIPVAFVLKVMKLEYADQLARVIGFQLGTKLFMLMSAP